MNLSGLSAVGPGMQQGQINIADLKQKALAIQNAQMQIDAQKRELAGQAALFQNMGQQGGQGGPQMQPPPQTGQPPMPGQSSQPMQPPPQQVPLSPVGMRPGMVAPSPVGPMPPGGPGSAPQGGPPPGGMQQQPQQQGDPNAPLSPQSQMQLITQIAQSIKARSPGIDAQTLFEAVKQQIALMGALSNTQKQQLTYAVEQVKAATTQRGQDVSASNTQARVGAQERGQDIGAQNTDKRVGATERGQDIGASNAKLRADTSTANTNAKIDDADRRLTQTQDAINRRQDKSLQGKATAKVQTERLAVLRAQLAQAKAKLSAANASMDQGQIASAQKAVDGVLAQITQFQTKSAAGGGGGPPASGGSGPQASGPTATDAQGNKVQWNGTA